MRAVFLLSAFLLLFFIAGCGSDAKPVANVPASEAPAANGLVNDHDPSEEYIVWVDKLNLRSSPSSDSDIVMELAMSDILIYESSVGEKEIAGNIWGKFYEKNSQKSGWVVKRFILPKLIYEQFRKASELGKVGKNTDMMAELKRIDGEINSKATIVPSPDGKKVVIGVLVPNDIVGPILYFCANAGLKDVLGNHQWHNQTECWTGDSRFILDLVPISSMNTVFCYDTKTQKVTHFNSVSGSEYVLLDDLTVLWLKMENPTDIGEFHGVFMPSMMMSNLESGKTTRILKADVSTLRNNQNANKNVPEVKLIPDEATLSIVTASPFYLKYANQYVETGESDG